MLQATYEEVRAHLDIVLGINLEDHLDFRESDQLKHYALCGALIVAYRYAEALGERLRIFDMNVGFPHKSHLVGTELDFGHSQQAHDPVTQANIIRDLIRVRELMLPETKAFRLGLYFARFDDADAIANCRTFADYERMYGANRHVSMHLGVRYKFESEDYKGGPTSSNYGPFSFWGKGSEGFGRSGFWLRRIGGWDIGLIRERASIVAAQALADLAALDRSPPTMVVLGAGLGTGPLPRAT